MVRNSSVSLSPTLVRNEQVEHYIIIKTHKPIVLKFWVEIDVDTLWFWVESDVDTLLFWVESDVNTLWFWVESDVDTLCG